MYVTFASLASDLEIYGPQLLTATGPQAPEGVADALGRIAQLAKISGQIWSVLQISSPATQDEGSITRAIQIISSLLAAIVSRSQKQPQHDQQFHARVLLMSRIICLALVHTDPASLAPEVIGSVASSLAEYILRFQTEVDCQYLQDVMGWLLHCEWLFR